MIARRLASLMLLAAGAAIAQVDQPPAQQAPPPKPQPQPPQPQPQCPPPSPGAAAQPLPPGSTISGSSICGATIVGGTISGATIVGGTISGSAISGGTISGGGAAPPPPAPNPPAPAGPPVKKPAPPAQKPPENNVQAAPPARRGDASREKRKQPGSGGDAKSDEDDEEDLAARALERALVQRGALLLPVWGFEIAPAVGYGHTSQNTIATVQTSSDAPPVTVSMRRRTHSMTGSLTARFGLPFDFQLEASLPATFVLSDVVLGGAASSSASGFGPGDPRISLTWQLLHGGAVAPDIFIAGTWKPTFGSSPYDTKAGQVGLGTGYHSVGGTVTAVKSADPLVLLANVGYTANLPVTTAEGKRDPGNTYAAGGGAILAVSPETSLSFLIDFHYKPDDYVNGKAIAGSDETAALLQLGLGRVLSRQVLMNVTVAMGLTADAPNFQFGISMPIRF